MTVAQFRKLALGLSDTEERAHMGHPDFRVRGKIFATLGYPDKNCGAVMLTPGQQSVYLQSNPEAFVPAAGAWGLAGSTVIRLKSADPETVGEALTYAWQNAAAKAKGRPKRPRSGR